ncbi:MAG: hypothetical protein FWE18_00185 [Alphaproteobacteria bacterium]|nr:hypothetical protein [Alphaproteobacteria bacterium]
MVKKIAEAGVDLIPNISENRIKTVMGKIDRIAQNTNSGISRIAGARGGVLGMGASMLGVIFNPLTIVIGAVVAIFTTLIGATKRLNEKFMDMSNKLMNEAQKQAKAFAIMGGSNTDNQAMYNVLDSQGINTSSVFSNVNERVSRGDLQQYKGMNTNDLITNLVDQARSMGVVDGRKYLEEIGLSDLEPLLYTQQDLRQLKQKAKEIGSTNTEVKDTKTGKLIKVNKLGANSNNIIHNAEVAENQALNDTLLAGSQNTRVNDYLVNTNNKIKQNQAATDQNMYNTLATSIATATKAIDDVNNTLLNSVLGGLYSILKFFGAIPKTEEEKKQQQQQVDKYTKDVWWLNAYDKYQEWIKSTSSNNADKYIQQAHKNIDESQ